MWTPPAEDQDSAPAPTSTWTPPADDRDDAPAPKTLGGLASNALSDAGQMASGVVGAIAHPIDTVSNVATHLPQIGHSMLHSWGLDSADSGHRMQTLADESYQHPISHALDAASVLFPAAKAAGFGGEAIEGANIAGKAGEAAEGLEHMADINRARDLGARTKAFGELGEEEAARIGRRAKEMGVEGSTRDQLAKARGIDATEGKRVGELRQVGDATGAAPEFPGLLKHIEEQLGPKYRTGLESGNAGELDKAVSELQKADQFRPVTPGEQLESAAGDATRDGWRDSDPMGMMKHEGEFPEDSYEKFRQGQEMDIPEFEHTQTPNTTDLAKKATGMNQWARNEKSLLRPSGAASDVANIVSNENDSALGHMLGSDKAQEYLNSLSKESDAKTMAEMLQEKRARELGTSHAPGSIPAKIVHGVMDRFGYSLTAKGLDKLASVVRQSPAMLGKYGPALANLGPAALATTAHVLMERDPAFAVQLEKAGISQ